MSKILLFGATGETGKSVLEQALAAGHEVRGAERDWPSNFIEHDHFEKCSADLLNGGLTELMEGVDVVVSAVGLGRDPMTLINPPPLYSEGAVNIIQAMRATGKKRLVVISAAFADPKARVPLWFKGATSALDRVFRQMGDMERVLRVCEDIEWTAVRPGWLLNRPMTQDYRVLIENLPKATLRTRRADLAHFMLDCATSDKHVHECPFIARKESTRLETPPALVEEIWPF
ncbi:hypothetical protein BPTFM16_00625 [Altererythrobacter insulae]|nr:hypothetical protein BPTFM16_00625 [Altererythrobacter insulae]